MSVTISLPWPPTELRPNFKRSNHWSKYQPIVNRYRYACKVLGMEQRLHLMDWPEGEINLTYTFHAPKGCRWDRDAREAAFKAGQDGIADAMGVDDRHFRAENIHGEPVKNGAVVVTVTHKGDT